MGPETSQKPRSAGRPKWPRLAEIALYAVAVFCLAVLLTRDVGMVISFFYSPWAILLLVFAFVEFLIIKGGDRSRLYLIELEKMREREQQYVARQRRALEEVQRALGRPQPSSSASEGGAVSPASSSADHEECLKRVEQILRPDLKE